MHNILPVLNFYSDETKFEAIAKGPSMVDTISFSDLFNIFYALFKFTRDLVSSFPFSLEDKKKRFFFSLASYVVKSPILHLIFNYDPLHSSIFHGIICGTVNM